MLLSSATEDSRRRDRGRWIGSRDRNEESFVSRNRGVETLTQKDQKPKLRLQLVLPFRTRYFFFV